MTYIPYPNHNPLNMAYHPQPKIKRIEYYENGAIKMVEYFESASSFAPTWTSTTSTSGVGASTANCGFGDHSHCSVTGAGDLLHG